MGLPRYLFQIRSPDKVEMKLTATMPLEDWRKVRERIREGAKLDYWHPAEDLARAVDELVTEAEKAFYAYSEKPDDE